MVLPVEVDLDIAAVEIVAVEHTSAVLERHEVVLVVDIQHLPVADRIRTVVEPVQRWR